MAVPGPPEPPRGAPRKTPSLLEMGALCLDSEIILGFTSHLLRRRGKVAEGSPAREPLPLLEVSSRKRLPAGRDQDTCGNRPAPEGAGAGTGAGAGAEQEHLAGGGGWCRHCHTKLVELKRQAWKLVSGSGTPLRDPCLSALLLDKPLAPGALLPCRPLAEGRCDVCATHLQQLTREALRLLQAPPSSEDSSGPHGGAGFTPLGSSAMASPRDAPVGPPGRQLGHQKKGPAWPAGPSVQVSVAPAGLGGALSTVTIQAQQCLEGMWSVSRVNSLLPPAYLLASFGTPGLCFWQELAVAVRVDGALSPQLVGRWSRGACGTLETGRGGGGCGGSGRHSPRCHPCGKPWWRVEGVGPRWGLHVGPGHPCPGHLGRGLCRPVSCSVLLYKKLSLASKRKKPPPPPAPAHTSPFPTDFSRVLRLSPPPVPPCLLRAPKAKDSPGSTGKVKVMLRIWAAQGAQRSAESSSFLKVDPRRKQVTLYDPAAVPLGSVGSRQAATSVVPRMFAFDAVFLQDSEQAEVCSGTVTDVLQSVVGGANGCILSFGPRSLGKSHTMIGKDSSPQSLGVVPCAISWLFRLMEEHKERTGTRFSVRVSAVEVCGRGQSLRDLLAELASGSLQDAQSPGCLREDPECGAQLQSQSELRAPTAEKAAFYLDAALAARSASRAGGAEDARCGSHLLFTLHVYQYRVEKCGQAGMSGGRSRLHLIDLGSCEAGSSRGGEAGSPISLSLPALGSVIMALASGAKHVPYRDHRLTMLLRESLATANCRATVIAHVSDAPAHHAETLSTVQLAARMYRLRRKKAKYASSSSGGESSCEEGRARRPPHLRPFHRRTVALGPDRPAPGLPGDPDYSSSSEQSCDTVIYVGPGGAALSDRELTDSEGPPDFVPIIPALSRRRPSEGPRDADHFRCGTFAELQERLECIDGGEGPWGPPGGTDGAQASPARGARKPSPPEAASPWKTVGAPMAASTPRGSPGPDAHCGAPEPSKSGAWGDRREDGSAGPEPPAPEKAMAGGGRRPLPSPAPPPPQQPEARRAPEELGGRTSGCVARTPPVGMSRQVGRPPTVRGPCLERGLLTTTVTLQQPVELNDEDELVFTVVEELSLGALAGAGRPASLASFSSDCSLQALASGSRPVSIISSMNDELDACAVQAPDGPADPLGGGAVSSWLGEVSARPTPQLPFGSDRSVGSERPGPPVPLGTSEDDGSLGLSGHARLGVPNPAQSPRPREVAAAVPTHPGRESQATCPRDTPAMQTIHSSLPRKSRTTSAASHAGCVHPGPSPPGLGGLLEDPWLLRADESDLLPMTVAGKAPSPTLGSPRPTEVPAVPACAHRAVDGCEGAARVARRPEAVARIPPLRRGATTLGVSTPTTSCRDALAEAEAVACSGSLKATSGSKRGLAPKGGFFPRPSGGSPPAPPVRKSSLEPRGGPAPATTQALSLTRAGVATALRGEEEARLSGRAEPSVPRATSSLKARAGKMEVAHRPVGHASLERCEGLGPSSRLREAPGRPARAVPRLGVPLASPVPGPSPACKGTAPKAIGTPKPLATGGKGRSLAAGGSRALGASGKPPAPVASRSPGGPVMGPRMVPRAVPGAGPKAGRGTVMGTKQALRAAHSRVSELAAAGAPGRGGPWWGSADSDSGNDSGVNLGEERPPAGPALPSPYSKVTAPRRPQRYSSGHGSDNSSVLSGELPPAMGRTALFYHSGGSSGYESMLRDSEATGSASSAPDSTSESGAASPGTRPRSLKSPKKRATGLQRRRLIPAPLPDATVLGRKPSLSGQWVDLPPPLAGSLKEPFEIKVYEIDDVARLQRHRPPLREEPAEVPLGVEKGPECVGAELRLAGRRLQRLREVQAEHNRLREELAETQGRLMVEPGRWLEQFEVDPELEPESAEYLAALERATAALEQCVNLCKARVMMITCFDVGVAAAIPAPQEVDV